MEHETPKIDMEQPRTKTRPSDTGKRQKPTQWSASITLVRPEGGGLTSTFLLDAQPAHLEAR